MSAPVKFSVIVPVLNSKQHLRACLNSIQEAMENYGNAELIILDNGSEDGSYEILLNEYCARATIQQIRGIGVSALRNHGAQLANGEFLAFIDSDCVIVPDYFEQALNALLHSGADATGSEYALDDSYSWIEETWYVMHTPSSDGFVKFISAGNFVIRRQTFLAVNGFDESMISVEDQDLGVRLNKAGFRIYQTHAVRAFHPGGDKSLRVFFLKNTWRSMGIFGMLKNTVLFKPIITIFIHALLVTLSLVYLVGGHAALVQRVAIFAILSNLAPVLTVIYRAGQTGRFYRPLQGILLYHIYFLAQLYAVWNIAKSWGASPEVKHARSVRLYRSAKVQQ
jgi:glycosyltransferase involved in cell wall biosynthesis